MCVPHMFVYKSKVSRASDSCTINIALVSFSIRYMTVFVILTFHIIIIKSVIFITIVATCIAIYNT